MKKKLICSTSVITLIVAISYGFYYSRNKIELSDSAKANVEALARGESGGIPWQGSYSNWDKGGCCEIGRWSDVCPNSPCKED